MKVFTIVQCITAVFIATTQVSAVYFGTATDRPSNFGNIVPSSFNLLVAENAMKWGSMQSSATSVNYSTAKSLMSYAKSNGMKMRGHALVWHAQMPSFICGSGCPSTSYSGSQLQQLIDDRIKGVFANLDHTDIICWDVVNEAIADGGGPMRNSAFVQKMGTNFVETVFRIARKYAPPNVKLFYNDYNCEVYGNQKTTNCFNLVKDLKSKGLIDGMGFQMHLSLQYGENSQMGGFAQTMKQYTDLGLDVHITEMDVGIANTSGTESQLFQTQANWYANIAKICKANPKCTAFVVWGVTDNTSWRADGKPLLFTSNSQKKPAYDAVVAALGGSGGNPPTQGPSPTTRPPTSGPSPTTRPPTSAPTNAPAPPSGGVARWGQCGGLNYTGPKTCNEGTCKYVNDWYSQCQ